MPKTVWKILLGSALLIALSACAAVPSMPTAVPTLNPNTINTAIAGTMAVASTQTTEAGVPITGGESPTPTPTEAATETPTEALSPTPAFTPTSAAIQISVSVATNCRTGPGIAYPRVGGLLVGQVAQVIGRNADSTFWVIQDPNRPSQTCWVWGQFAVVTGNTGSVPVFTPPPPPAPTAMPSATITLTPMSTSTTPSPTATATP